jgi:hypothetical protein
MTRKDWWLGILVIVLVLIIQTLVIIRVTRDSRTSAFRFLPLNETAAQRF